MKKSILAVAVILGTTTTFAQDLTSKKGENYLPEAGDWAISVDATPFLNYAGNFIGGNGTNSAPGVGYTNGYPWSIKGKMFADETTAYRAGVRIAFGSMNYSNLIGDAADTVAANYPTLPGMVTDEYKSSYNNVVLTGGLEMRRGNSRLQGFYGGELMFGMGGTKDTYTYGNAINTSINANMVDGSSSYATSWNGGSNFTMDAFGNDSRYTEVKSSSLMFGLRGFIGAEYFIFPKIALGFEYGWGFGFMSTKTSMTHESRGYDNAATPALHTSSFTDDNKTSGFALDSDIQGVTTGLVGGSGSINLTFHF